MIYDTSKDGAFSRAYGDFYRFSTKHFNFSDDTEEGWTPLIKESSELCGKQFGASYEPFVRHLYISYMSWKDKQIRSDAPAPITDNQFSAMLIDFWKFIISDVNLKYHGNGFWNKWADVAFAEELMSNYHYLTDNEKRAG